MELTNTHTIFRSKLLKFLPFHRIFARIPIYEPHEKLTLSTPNRIAHLSIRLFRTLRVLLYWVLGDLHKLINYLGLFNCAIVIIIKT